MIERRDEVRRSTAHDSTAQQGLSYLEVAVLDFFSTSTPYSNSNESLRALATRYQLGSRSTSSLRVLPPLSSLSHILHASPPLSNMSFDLSFDMELLPPSHRSLFISWHCSNTSHFSLELEQVYQLALEAEWNNLTALLSQLQDDYAPLNSYITQLSNVKLPWFFDEEEKQTFKLRERMRKQILGACDGPYVEYERAGSGKKQRLPSHPTSPSLVLHQQRHAFLWRRMHEPHIRDLELGFTEKIAKIIGQLQPLAVVARPLTVAERRFCKGAWL